MKKKFQFLILLRFILNYFPCWIIVVLCLTNCDSEKWWGFSYDTEPLPESAKFHGTIIDKFTFEPIKLAHISVNKQTAITNNNGDFLFYYHYSEDEERNQPVPITIWEKNYLPLDSTLIVFPENRLDIQLEYATPEILNICLVDTLSYCQAIVHDFQGFTDISLVEIRLAYGELGAMVPSLYIKMPMSLVLTDSVNIAYFQLLAPDYIEGSGYLLSRYEVYAKDSLNYYDTKSHAHPVASDSILFPIQY